ncbi:MAG: hypothetical protein GF411_18885 [Candidatus Lokiarchaeota archaeon]|nr:hypothetical protein [Candidatus Lokiarchaeota archaeon]
MGKLHEIIAVEGDHRGAYQKILNEATATFKNKPNHFMAQVRHYEPFDENDPDVLADEEVEMVTTVDEKLDYIFSESIIPYLDVLIQKERTNQEARTDLVVDGVTIAKDVPATFLLGLETRLKDIRQVLDNIPTLQPGIKWEKDETHVKATTGTVYKTANPVEKRRTKKVVQHKVLYDATDKHPAQIEKWNEDAPIGKFIETHWSGVLSPADKSSIISRVDKLQRAVKKARQRANEQEILNVTIGKEIANYILGK